MRTVYLIRHGLPDFPGGKRMCLGRTDLPLCAEGFLQAQKMAEQMKDKKFSVFSSPLLRARQTAQALNRPVTILEDLKELYAGLWEGLTFDTIRQQFPELYAARAYDKSILLPEGEPNEQGLARFRNALQEAMAQCDGDLAIVGHSGIMAVFLQAELGQWEKLQYAQVVALTYDQGRYYKKEEENNA